MKKFLKIRNILIGCVILLISCISYILLTDEYDQAKFRTMQDAIPSSENVDLTGLREIQASGGPSINFPDLKQKLAPIKKHIIIIDALRQYHGYIKEIPTTFFAYERHHPDWRHMVRRLIFTGTIRTCTESIVPESEMAKRYGFEYKKIMIDSKVLTPDESVDEFVAFVDNLPDNRWVHFHCRLGKGRTSMMLTMLDIMKNAPKVALNDIAKRQYLLGSENLFNTVARSGGTYYSKTLTRRKQFIEDFYKFVCQRKGGGTQRWSDWHQQQNVNNTVIANTLSSRS